MAGAGQDSRPKCPVCASRVSDGAARDPGPRWLAPPILLPEFQNPKNAAQAARIRAQNLRG